MAGLFYVHSNITEKISKKIAEEKHSKSIFVEDYRYSSGMENSLGIEEIYNFKEELSIFETWKKILEGDRKLKAEIKENFHAYVHHLSNKEVELIVSHKMCTGYSIIEEGLDSYLREEVMESKLKGIKRSIKYKIKYMMRIGKKRFFRDDEDMYYSVSEKAFPGRKNKENLKIDFGKKPKKEESGCIIICESLKYWNKEQTSKYLLSLLRALKMIKKNYAKVLYKFHPDSYGKWEKTVTKKAIEEFGPPSDELDRHESIEDVAIGSGLDVFVYLSSVGLYCGMFSDSDVYSFYPITSEAAGAQVDYRSEPLQYVPDIYWDHVQLLGQEKDGAV